MQRPDRIHYICHSLNQLKMTRYWWICLYFFTGQLFAQTDTIKKGNLSEVVITGTKTFKRKTESPVIVNILDSKTLSNLQVCNLSEGLKFQPGLREFQPGLEGGREPRAPVR